MTKRLLEILVPLLALNVSHYLIVFMDRIFLSRYNLEAMNAVTVAGVTASIFHFSIVSLVSAVEVLVAEYTGAGRPYEAARAVWQMILLGVGSWVVFIPLGLWGGDLLLPQEYREYGAQYFQILMFAGPLFPLIAAITNFFVGIGRVRVVILVIIITTLANITLDYVMIPRFGTISAAWSNVATQVVNLLVLGGVFFSRQYNVVFRTRYWQVHKDDFLKCMSLGLPIALSYFFDMFAWFLILQLVSKMGPTYLTVYSIGESIIFLCAFFWDSLAKSVLAICSTLVGEENFLQVSKLWRASFVVYGCFSALVFVGLNFFSQFILSVFFQNKEIFVSVLDEIQIIFFLISLYNMTDGFGWLMTSYLTSFHRNILAAFASATTIWTVALGPLLAMIVWGVSFRETLVWELMLLYSSLNSLILFYFVRRFLPH